MIVPLRFYLTGPDLKGRKAVGRILAEQFGFSRISAGEALGLRPDASGAHEACRLAPCRTVIEEVRSWNEASLLRRSGYEAVRVEQADVGTSQPCRARWGGTTTRLGVRLGGLPDDWVLRYAPGGLRQQVRLLVARATLDAVERAWRAEGRARAPAPHAG